MKTKICIITHFNYSDAGAIHGPAHTISSYLCRNKMPYTFIAYPLYAGAKSILEEFNGEKENKKEFSYDTKLPLTLKSLFETFYTWYFLLKNKPEIVIAIDPLNAFAVLLVKKLFGVKKVIFYTVDYSPNRFPNQLLNWLYHQIDLFCIKNADFIWNVSNRIVEKRREQGVEDKRNLYVPNAPSIKVGVKIPLSKIDRFNIMMVTGITHSPAFTMVIEAVSALIKKYPKLSLILIGTGAYEKELRNKIDKSALKTHVKFLGQLNHEDLLKTLPKGGLGLAIYTSDYDWINYGDSMKAREYLLSGLPVVITDVVSTAQDIVKYDAGISIPPNAKEIQHAIEKIIKNQKNWEKYRKNALLLAKDFDIDKILDRAFLKL